MSEICPISLEEIKNPIKFECNHIFDFESVIGLYENSKFVCPLCRAKILKNEIIIKSNILKDNYVVDVNKKSSWEIMNDFLFGEITAPLLNNVEMIEFLNRNRHFFATILNKTFVSEEDNETDYDNETDEDAEKDDEMTINNKIVLMRYELKVNPERKRLKKYIDIRNDIKSLIQAEENHRTLFSCEYEKGCADLKLKIDYYFNDFWEINLIFETDDEDFKFIKKIKHFEDEKYKKLNDDGFEIGGDIFSEEMDKNIQEMMKENENFKIDKINKLGFSIRYGAMIVKNANFYFTCKEKLKFTSFCQFVYANYRHIRKIMEGTHRENGKLILSI